MKSILLSGVLLSILIFLTACPLNNANDDSDTSSDFPPIPLPSYVGDSLPDESKEITLEIGKEIDSFNPYVEAIKKNSSPNDILLGASK